MMASKYGARSVEIDGLRFASKAEGRRYEQLRLLELAGEIRNLLPHPRFALYVPKFDKPITADMDLHLGPQSSGWVKRVGHYTADFAYETKDGRTVVEDVKGGNATKTEAYRLRKRIVEATYGFVVTEVQS
jgi:hypothetical protein